MMEVLLRVDPLDGNDPIEAVVNLPIVPRKGDAIEMWDAKGGFINPGGPSGTACWAEVEYVVLTAYAPERIEVWLKFDTFDIDEVKRAMAGVEFGDTP